MTRKVLLGVTGGIAAYKACDLVRRLRERDWEVQVVLTPGAETFVTPLSFQALSGRSVRTTLFDPGAEAAMGHIELARWADLILVAPASADFLARAAQGMANDLLTTVLLACPAPVVMAPAMNQQMWKHPAVQANVEQLRQRGVRMLGPGVGDQACGDVGAGRMLEPAEIVAALSTGPTLPTGPVGLVANADSPLRDVSVLLTAGPTREALDPVRYLSNRSSGRMGFALAAALRDVGARVTLVHGPCAVPVPSGVNALAVESAEQMHAAVLSAVDAAQMFIGCAAVADYRPLASATHKIKKTAATLELKLERNPDILAAVTARRPDLFAVGFAAETDDLERYARDKLARKNLALICANEVGPGKGFDVADNTLQVYWVDGQRQLGPADKPSLARELVALLAERYTQQPPHRD